jgi:hypothetical protein
MLKESLPFCCRKRGKDVWGKEVAISASQALSVNLPQKGDRPVELFLVECEEEIKKSLHSWDDGRVYAHLAFIQLKSIGEEDYQPNQV